MTCCARCIAIRALLRFSSTTCMRRRAGCGPRLDVFLELRQPALRLLEREDVLLRVDRADELVAIASSSARRTSNRAVSSSTASWASLHLAVRLHLDDLLLRLGELGACLLEGVVLIGGIEFHHHVPGLDRNPGRHHADDAEHAADRRCDQRDRSAGAQFPGRMNVQLQRSADDPGRRYAAGSFGKSRDGHRVIAAARPIAATTRPPQITRRFIAVS